MQTFQNLTTNQITCYVQVLSRRESSDDADLTEFNFDQSDCLLHTDALTKGDCRAATGVDLTLFNFDQSDCLLHTGALTKGDRRAASGADLTEFNFDTPYGRNGLRAVYSAICGKFIVPGISVSAITGSNKQDFATFNEEMMVRNNWVFFHQIYCKNINCDLLFCEIHIGR